MAFKLKLQEPLDQDVRRAPAAAAAGASRQFESEQEGMRHERIFPIRVRIYDSNTHSRERGGATFNEVAGAASCATRVPRLLTGRRLTFQVSKQ